MPVAARKPIHFLTNPFPVFMQASRTKIFRKSQIREYYFENSQYVYQTNSKVGSPYSNPALFGGVRFFYYGRTTKLRVSSRSSRSTFCTLRSYFKLATFKPDLQEHVSFTMAGSQRAPQTKRLQSKTGTSSLVFPKAWRRVLPLGSLELFS